MASEGGGKMKNNRGRSLSKPYERRKSIFSRITNSLRDVFRPSWLSTGVSSSHSNEEKDDLPPDNTQSQEDYSDNVAGSSSSFSQISTASSALQQTSNKDFLQKTHILPSDSQSSQLQQNELGLAGGLTVPGLRQSSHGKLSHENLDVVQKQNMGLHHFRDKTADRSLDLRSASESSFALSNYGQKLRVSNSSIAQTESRESNHRLFISSDVTVATKSSSASLDVAESSEPDESHAKRQRLLSPEMSRRGKPLQPAVQDKPSFKISVFCTPDLNEPLHESSFYSGKTTFGGASAYQRRSLNTSLPYQNSLPIRKPIKAKPRNNSANAVMSSSATQILKALERFAETKKGGASETPTDSVLSFTPSSYRTPSRPILRTLPSRSLELPARGPPTSQLLSPAVASIARNHQVTSIAMLQAQHHTSASLAQDKIEEDKEIVQEQEGGVEYLQAGTGSGKMKRTKTYEIRKSKTKNNIEESVEMPVLRTDYKLPVASMPAFSFGLQTAAGVLSKPGTVLSKPATTLATASKATEGTDSQHFTFSLPIQKSEPSGNSSSTSPILGFQFRSPLKVAYSVPASLDKTPFVDRLKTGPITTTFGTFGSTAPKPKFVIDKEEKSASGSQNVEINKSMEAIKPASELKSGSVLDALGSGVFRSSDRASVTFGEPSKTAAKSDNTVKAGFGVTKGKEALTFMSSQPASELKQGSVMDVLSKGSSSTSKTGCDDLLAKLKPQVGTWECVSCMVYNKPEVTKCAACEAPRPDRKESGVLTLPQSSSASKGTDSFFAKFSEPMGTWECEACMVHNKPDVNRCIACEASKPGSISAGHQTPVTKTDDLFSKFRKPTGSWDCDVCLVQNTEANTKCVACTSPRPGTQPTGSMPGLEMKASSQVTVGVGGGLIFTLTPSSTSASSPFLTVDTASKSSSSGFISTPATGFRFSGSDSAGLSLGGKGLDAGSGGTSAASTSISSPLASGFKAGATNASTSKDSTSGFKIETIDPSKNSSLVPSPTGCQLDSGSYSLGAGSGFTFSSHSSNAGFVFSKNGTPTTNDKATPSSIASSIGIMTTSSTSNLGSTAPKLFTFGSSVSIQNKDLSKSNDSSQLNNSENTVGKETTCTVSEPIKFTPVFGLGHPSNNKILGTAPSLVTAGSNVTSSGLLFSSNTNNVSSFGSGVTSNVAPLTEPNKLDSGSITKIDQSKQNPGFAGFNFQASSPSNKTAPHQGLFTVPAGTGGDKVQTGSAFSSGFVFGGAAAVTPSTASSIFGTSSQRGSTAGSSFVSGVLSQPVKSDFDSTKVTVNGEVGVPTAPFVFGPAAANSVTSGFSFGVLTNSKPSNDTSTTAQAKSFSFGLDQNTASKMTSGKRVLDNDTAPTEVKKSLFNFPPGSSFIGAAEPFKFGSSNITGASIVKFGQTDGVDKPVSNPVFGNTSVFGSNAPSGGFAFSNTQHNAASSAGGSIFGSGGGTGSGGASQFPFSVQNNAAAAAAPVSNDFNKGFNFFSANQTSFNLGSSTTTPASGSVFQFGATQSGTSSQSTAGVFAFGQGSQSATNPTLPPTTDFSTTPGLAFGSTPTVGNFNIGTADNRKIKRAVRRTRKI